MVSSVSGVPQNSKIGAMDKVSQAQIYSPGAYSMPQVMQRPVYRREKGGFGRFLGKVVLTAAAVFGGAVLARKNIKSIKNIDLASKEGGKIKRFIAKLGDDVMSAAKKLFKKAPKAAENAADAAENATK